MRHLPTWTVTLMLACGVHATTALSVEHPTDPQGFVQRATDANLTEIALGNLAQARSSNPAVISFATRMIADHTQANDELAALVKAKSIVASPMDPSGSPVVKQLGTKKGKAFDKAYADHMIHDHAAALELFQANVSHPDGEIAAYVGRMLPALQEHRRLAENLKANLK